MTQKSLVPYDKVENPIDFAEKMGRTFTALTGCTIDQGPAVALTCLVEGLTPLEFNRRYHMIGGKPSRKTDSLLAEFVTSGGKYEILERTPARAAIRLEMDDKTFEGEYTWEQAEQDRWPWNNWRDHSEGLKDNWSTPSDKRSMLWNRLISDSLRAFCPVLIAGIYTPEEIMDVEQENSQPEPVHGSTIEVVEVHESHAPPAPQEPPFEAADEAEPEQEVAAEDDQPAEPATCSEGQAKKLYALVEKVGMTMEQQQEALKKRGVKTILALSPSDADELIQRLESVAAKVKN